MAEYLHNHPEFAELLRIIENDTSILASLIEKDYWIMHVLYSLKKQGFIFELKGGTSLSKGYHIIERFSEDIDIHIKPPAHFNINENPKNTNINNAGLRRAFYDWLKDNININGVTGVVRDTLFDETRYYRSGGIRLLYNTNLQQVEGIKDGILLEAGFDTITPNQPVTISSWAYDRAYAAGVDIIDNRAIDIACYNPEFTLVEKLQTIATKFRTEQSGESVKPNFMRQYYDVYCLLGNMQVQQFIGTPAYIAHKKNRFPAADLAIPIAENEAFLLSNAALRAEFSRRYAHTLSLYYNGQPSFANILKRIKEFAAKL